jgi:hypothetical protein
MLIDLFAKLDRLIAEENVERRDVGTTEIPRADIRVVGQMALIEAAIDLDLAATQDLDAFLAGDYWIQKRLEQLLAEVGMTFDDTSDLIWMPSETEYIELYAGRFVRASRAKVEYVLLSKAHKAPRKNAPLIIEYLAKDPSDLFWSLVATYNVDLQGIVDAE